MKCKNCGFEFAEGIFCPECGTKIGDISVENTKIMESDAEKKEKERLEKEEQEKQRLEREKLEVERLVQENTKKELESRTVRGTVYKTLEEADLAKKEHNIFDNLKSQLLETKSQKRRQEILSAFKTQFQVADVEDRYIKLKNKVNREVPVSEKVNFIYGITVLITFFFATVFMMSIEGEASLIGKICFVWAAFGVWIWPIWKLIQVIKSKGASHYKNIKGI